MHDPEPIRVPVDRQPTHQLRLEDRLALSVCLTDGGPVVAMILDDAYLIIPTERLRLFQVALARCIEDREAVEKGAPLRGMIDGRGDA